MVDPDSRLAPYRAVLSSRMQSQRSYRLNFRLDLASSFLVGLVELAEIWVLYRSVHQIGGLSFAQVLLVFGLADLPFSLADLLVGHCDNLPTYVRAGTLDVFYLRPQPLLLQLITSDISLRRLARAAVGGVSLGVGLWVNDIAWTPAHAGLLVQSLLTGTVIFAGMFVWASGAQFFLINGAELTNAFVYGGRYAATQPARGVVTAAEGPVRLRVPDGLHRLPAGAGSPRSARAAVVARLAGVVDAGGRRVDVGDGAAELAMGGPALPGRRRLMPIIQTRGLTREFTRRDGLRRSVLTAVDELSFAVEAGESVGYIGANGAGKSTTIKMLDRDSGAHRAARCCTCGLRPVPGAPAARAPHRCRVRPAHPALVGPAGGRVLPDPGRDTPSGRRCRT